MAVLSIDQGTTGTTVLITGKDGRILAKSYREFPQVYPRPGWVEHDPEEIWQSVLVCLADTRRQYPDRITAAGITNQRETTVIWDASTGKPVYNAIVWQCRRTSAICETLEPKREIIREKTGLPPDAYFSGTKARWILENAEIPPGADLRFGTIDTWLIWKLTGGTVHATDYTNASRTLLFNIHNKCWDAELCSMMHVPEKMLPEVRPSSGNFGTIRGVPGYDGLPILGNAGDQQAALFGQQCFRTGEAKNTYGTGCFLMMNTGKRPVLSTHGLLTTLAADPEGNPCYALEGSVFIAGAAIQWLRDEIGLLNNAAESETAADAVTDNGGVYLVPAFAGLGAPYWNMNARGILTGLTRGANRHHIIRAALESMAYQTLDVVRVMERETGEKLTCLAADGGATRNNFLMQFQADILGIDIHRASQPETTALGAAYLAGIAAGIWTSADLRNLASARIRFKPNMDKIRRDENIRGWEMAVRQALTS